ncbi:alpha/beta hydrolase [Chitinophaga sp.]|uniref:alpha/beta fold hydrolase n=1 Tax=Chitinophaga sp. TaxID=1869181 RepID=UPI0031D05D81
MKNTLISFDGTPIIYETRGQGPGLIIIHGALSDIGEYTQLAAALSEKFTVHLLQRRDRAGARKDYSITHDCNDLLALQQATGAAFLFGHSYGGLVALEAVVHNNPFKKIVVYEPGVSIAGNWHWLGIYDAAMARNQYRKAFTAFVQGMGHSPLSKAPAWLANLILRIAIKGEDWQLKKSVLGTNLREHLEVKRLEGSYRKYASLSTPVLLAGGTASPDFITHMLHELKQTIPLAVVALLPGLHHLSPTNHEDPAKVAAQVSSYLSSGCEK